MWQQYTQWHLLSQLQELCVQYSADIQFHSADYYQRQGHIVAHSAYNQTTQLTTQLSQAVQPKAVDKVIPSFIECNTFIHIYTST